MKYFTLILILFSASFTNDTQAPHYVVIWNVGQGQFVTSVSPTSCLHLDMGGEFFPWKKIFTECKDKNNFAFLSHWDWDHIGALGKLSPHSTLKKFCIALPPLGPASEHKMKIIKSFPTCDLPLEKLPVHIWKPRNGNDSNINSRSQVVLCKDVLTPGDSPIPQEKIWSQLPWIRPSRILILGHHGSKTSTSQELLKALPNVKMAISSARWNRYHHPHPIVEANLSKARIPLLRTEDWGNIWIEQ
ncbi:MAG: ComEC/Rec2 family competence protein [Pseudobdellovibrionaceae bacterium]